MIANFALLTTNLCIFFFNFKNSASGCPIANRGKIRHDSLSESMSPYDVLEIDLKNEGPACPTPGMSCKLN